MKKIFLLLFAAIFFIAQSSIISFLTIVAQSAFPRIGTTESTTKDNGLAATSKQLIKAVDEDDDDEEDEDDIEIDKDEKDSKEDIEKLKKKKDAITVLKRGLTDFLTSKITRDIQDTTNKSNPYRFMDKPAREVDELSGLEEEFLNKRLVLARIHQEKVLKKEHITKDETLRIGLVLSGGGTPSYIAAIGFMHGLNDLNILNCATYAAAVGGASGALLKYVVNNGDITKMIEAVRAQAESKTFNPFIVTPELKNDLPVIARDVLWPRMVFKRNLSNADLFGALLIRKILPELTDKLHRTFLYDLENISRTGDILFPLFNSVLNVRERINWLEFSPIEITELSSLVAVPSFAFDRKYEDGEAQDRGPTKDLGSLLGNWWESTDIDITLNTHEQTEKRILETLLDEINNLFKQEANSIFDKSAGTLEAIQNQALVFILDTFSFVGLKEKTFVNNPWFEFEDAPGWLNDPQKLHLKNAVTECSIAGQSLLRKDRKMDVIFILDASESKVERTDLNDFFAYAKKIGHSYIRIDNQKNETFGVYEDAKGKGPGVVYINNIKNKGAFTDTYLKYRTKLRTFANTYNLQKFDPETCNQGSVCTIFDYDLNKELFDGFFGLASYNIQYNEKAILQALERFYTKKREKLGVDHGDEEGHPGFHTGG